MQRVQRRTVSGRQHHHPRFERRAFVAANSPAIIDAIDDIDLIGMNLDAALRAGTLDSLEEGRAQILTVSVTLQECIRSDGRVPGPRPTQEIIDELNEL